MNEEEETSSAFFKFLVFVRLFFFFCFFSSFLSSLSFSCFRVLFSSFFFFLCLFVCERDGTFFFVSNTSLWNIICFISGILRRAFFCFFQGNALPLSLLGR
jgi:hypothetical protein